MLALPPPFVLQWERECNADALLSAAQPASEQCIGLMQCSCVLTHSTSPPPVCLLLPPVTVTIFSPLTLSVCFSHVRSLAVSLCSPSLDHFTCADPPLSLAVGLPQPIVQIKSLPFQEVRLFSPTPELLCVLSPCLVSAAVRQCFQVEMPLALVWHRVVSVSLVREGRNKQTE